MRSNRKRISKVTVSQFNLHHQPAESFRVGRKHQSSQKRKTVMTQMRKTATILRRLNSDPATVDSALSELEARRTAIIHRIGSYSSSGSHPPGILQFPGAL